MATVPAPGKRAPSGVVMAVLGREDAHVPLVPVLDGTAVEVQATELVSASWDWGWPRPRLGGRPRFEHHQWHLNACSSPSTAQSTPHSG